jgi:integrator complex subunit 9
MMEELFAMHSEFVKLYGPPSCMLPFWLDCRELEAAPVMLRERILGKDGTDIGNWHRLYRYF